MERRYYRATSLVDIQAELRQRDLLREADARRRAAHPHPVRRTGWIELRVFGRRILG
jgi:hypothetical protein